ncbi:MAG TPA: DUF1232 domain-containing protein [Candidatus Limnocylindrales bacterium]
MAKKLGRTAAFVALWRQLRTARRDGPGFGTRLRAIPRMTVASLRARRRYDGLWRIGMMAVATAYILSPVELVPEILLGPVGLLDDAMVGSWLAGAILSETGRFLDWERRQLPAPSRITP